MEVESSSITLVCVYPRKDLTNDIDDTTLGEQGLSPSGVVIVRTTTVSSHSSNTFCNFKLLEEKLYVC